MNRVDFRKAVDHFIGEEGPSPRHELPLDLRVLDATIASDQARTVERHARDTDADSSRLDKTRKNTFRTTVGVVLSALALAVYTSSGDKGHDGVSYPVGSGITPPSAPNSAPSYPVIIMANNSGAQADLCANLVDKAATDPSVKMDPEYFSDVCRPYVSGGTPEDFLRGLQRGAMQRALDLKNSNG